MPGVNGESRVHDAVGHPAGEELGAGASGAGETADVVAEIHQAGHAHPHAHPGVVPQGAPGGGIVTTPGLDVALQPERSGPGNEEGALAGSGLALGLVGGAIHEQGLHRADPVEFHRVTKTVTGGVLGPQFVLVVVVPGGFHTHVDELAADVVLPPLDAARIGEVDIAAVATPEHRGDGFAGW